MDILIIGTGAIGSLLAFQLGVAGHQVTTVGRPAYVQAVNSRGVFLDRDGRACCIDCIQAVETTKTLKKARFDLVLITTKVFDTAVAAVQALPFVQQGALALVIQNGVGGIDTAQGILGEHNLFAGIITIPVESPKPAVIRAHLDKGGIGIAAVNGRKTTPLVGLFSQAGFETRLYADWRSLKWSKLMLNLLANAIPAILDWPLEKVYVNRGLYELEIDALREARVVVRELKIELVSLPGYHVPIIVGVLSGLPIWSTHALFQKMIVGGRNGKQPSLHIELSRGRDKSEVAFLNGAVARSGVKLGIPTPTNQALCDMVSGITQGQIKWSEYRGQADRLIHRIQSKNRKAIKL
ncbi:MAG: ketopantoate reductase family protein [Anaerolineae bacterium]|nr:ketopantoate reductase family protein [Anaerolineae bacterium]